MDIREKWVRGLSVLGTITCVVVPISLSWYGAAMDRKPGEPAARARLYLVTTTQIAKGMTLRDEHVVYRVGRSTVQDPIPHHSAAIGRYARRDLDEGTPLTRAHVSVVTETAPTADHVLVAVPVKPFYATHLAVGMTLAFARSEPADDSEGGETQTNNGDQDDTTEQGGNQTGQTQRAPAPAAGASESESEQSQKKDVLGFDDGYALVAMSTSGEGDSAVAVLEVLVPRNESIIGQLAAAEWRPVVLAHTAR